MNVLQTIAAIRKGERPDYDDLLEAARALATLAGYDKHLRRLLDEAERQIQMGSALDARLV